MALHYAQIVSETLEHDTPQERLHAAHYRMSQLLNGWRTAGNHVPSHVRVLVCTIDEFRAMRGGDVPWALDQLEAWVRDHPGGVPVVVLLTDWPHVPAELVLYSINVGFV